MKNKPKASIKKVSAVMLVLIIVWLMYMALYEPRYNGQLVSKESNKTFSHRGLGNYAPDNSLVGAKIAVETGFDGVDVDGQMTKDGEIVIYHDLSINRLTTSTGKVNKKTLAELRALDLGTKYTSLDGKKWDGSYVASFEDFVREITPKGILMVELKVPGGVSTGIEQKAVDIIKKYNAFDKVYLSSFNPLVLYRLKQIDPRTKTVFIFMDSNWNPEIRPEDRVDLPWFLKQEDIRKIIRKIIKPDALSVNNEVDEKIINLLIDKGNPVFLWTIDEKERLMWAKEKKPYGIISDEPYRARDILNTKE
jgi:glycerophosphoryl diester phosphodiesterase